MRIAYFDCFSGISGDMTLGAFVDLGVPVEWLAENLKQIPLTGFELSAGDATRHGIHAKQVRVEVTNDVSSRNYADIVSMISESSLSPAVRELSLDIFDRIAEAEAGIHQCPKDEVHFHEVGGIDAIVDIVGTALCVEHLNIEKIVCSGIALGSGLVTCRHGTLPVPAPATLEILKGAPVYGTQIPHELATPTGAAIVAALATSFGAMPAMIVEKTGYGAGQREFESIPNLLRIVIGVEAVRGKDLKTGFLHDAVVIVETCIDDMNPEVFGFLMDRLFEDGALDVYWIPVYMKKNRPGTMVQVLCREHLKDTILNRLLSETTSSGARFYTAGRRMLAREEVLVDSVYGKIRAKRIVNPDGSPRMVPEYEACKKIALEKNIPIRIVYDTIARTFQA